nr:hypothetical protein Iba_chr07dCG12020 [Ipomoea batatas]GMD21093.1 hypothetical protein Iba_chr07fCG10870 [Ipomoea batatas]
MVWLSSSARCFARECSILPELSDDEGELLLSSEHPVPVLRCLFSVSFVTEPSFSVRTDIEELCRHPPISTIDTNLESSVFAASSTPVQEPYYSFICLSASSHLSAAAEQWHQQISGEVLESISAVASHHGIKPSVDPYCSISEEPFVLRLQCFVA